MNNELHNRKYLKAFRKELRNNSTKAESQLWKALQKKQLEGRKFRRQHSIGNYIVDFFCSSENLIVELDGQGHFNAFVEERDDKRTIDLIALGYRVIRFENKQVFDQLDMVLEAIKEEFKE
ncbi:endonuclease domain-containing protein [Sungkyunkwania multivorans]|uniref:Endonuclease domain-containing protein n=1 Tax=Sungkyunkwania multivorans TaxID=1173618 RepID=A0ABW3CVH4_9FLAO